MRSPPSRHLASAIAWLAALACAACEVATAPLLGDPPAPPPFDAGIEAVYLTQSVQDRAGTVPLVEGRDALVRVFLRARDPDLPAPAVRVLVVETATGAVLRSYPATSPLAQLPTALVEGALGGSWNVSLPGEEVQAGRHVVAEMDAIDGVPSERTQPTMRHPASGSLDVRAPPALLVNLVPIVQPDGLIPDVVHTRTPASWIERASAIHPLGAVEVGVGGTFTTGVSLGPDGTGWGTLLGELDRKRIADGTGRYYVGVVRVPYTSGTAGRADVGGRSALAWDGASYQRVAAHELGHNLGLRHAPCGNADPTSVDPDWPGSPAYADAHIGVFGWDPIAGVLKDPATTWDHMSYCGGTDTTWTSDYGYRAALSFLAPDAAAAAPRRAALAAAPARQPCLLVSGRIAGAAVELDPAYTLDTVPASLSPGDWSVDLLDAGGATLASASFAPIAVAAEEAGRVAEARFAMALPLGGVETAVRGIAIRQAGRERARQRAPAAAARDAVDVGEAPRGRRLRWDGHLHPEAMLRDARTGEVLGFARGGTALVDAGAAGVEVLLSDGVRTERRLLVPPR